MSTPKWVVVVSLERTPKSRFFDSIESKNQFLAPFEKNFLDGMEEARTGGGNTKNKLKSVTQTT